MRKTTVHVVLTKAERATLARILRARAEKLADLGVRDVGTISAWFRAHLQADATALITASDAAHPA